jgi:outer membrane protein TolC
MSAVRGIPCSVFVVLGFVFLLPGSTAAQPAATAPRTFELAALQRAAIESDPRMRQLRLLLEQSELRLRNIAVGRLPAVGVEGLAQYQSDVVHAPFTLPGGQTLFSPPKATFDAGVRIEKPLLDATLDARSALERSQLAEQQARVRTALYGLRQQVNDAFFAAAALQARAGALAATVADLQARLDEVNARVTQGMALPAEAAAVEATLLQRRQDEDELRTNREATLARLAILIGQPLRDGDVLPLPNVVETVARAQQASAAVRSRPEYEQFARTRDRLGRQADLTMAQERPRVWTFGKVAYGLPGLNFIVSEWEFYGFGGVRVEWKGLNWGAAAREREALAIGEQIVAADQAAFDRGLLESTAVDRASIERLQHALTVDERIVALREQVTRSTQIRLQEGVVTASEYLDRQAELLQARFARAGHEVELAQASARLLTTLGLEVQ